MDLSLMINVPDKVLEARKKKQKPSYAISNYYTGSYVSASNACCESLHERAMRYEEGIIKMFVPIRFLRYVGVKPEIYEAWLNCFDRFKVSFEKGTIIEFFDIAYAEWEPSPNSYLSGPMAAYRDIKLLGRAEFVYHDKGMRPDGMIGTIRKSIELSSKTIGYIISVPYKGHGGWNSYEDKYNLDGGTHHLASINQGIRYPYFKWGKDRRDNGRAMKEWYDNVYKRDDFNSWQKLSVASAIFTKYDHCCHNNYINPFATYVAFVPNSMYDFCDVEGITSGNFGLALPSNLSIEKSIMYDAYINKNRTRLKQIRVILKSTVRTLKDSLYLERKKWGHTSDSTNYKLRVAKSNLKVFDKFLKSINIGIIELNKV